MLVSEDLSEKVTVVNGVEEVLHKKIWEKCKELVQVARAGMILTLLRNRKKVGEQSKSEGNHPR